MDFAFGNLQWLISHKTKPNQKLGLFFRFYELLCHCLLLSR